MDLDRFTPDMRQHLVSISGMDPRTGEEYSHVAFMPPPLPRSLELSPATLLTVNEASHALGRLAQAALQVPNPALFRQPTVRREAQSTSALEGTYALLEDVLEADVAPDDAVRSPEVREVLNYVAVAEDAMTWARDGRPITVGMLSDMQGRLFHGTPSDTAETGRLRLIQVVVGAKDLPVEQARFVPPPPGPALESALQDWRDWIEDRDIPIPPVVRAALGHYQFECLHPYTDGNGRLGRLIIVLHLMRAGVIDEGLLAVSPWFEARRREYQDQLFHVSCTGDFDEWVKFFCAGVKARADATASAVVALVQYQAELRQLAVAEKLSGTIVHVLDDLIGRPVQTARSLADTHAVTPQTAYNIIRRLMELGVLVELTGRTYGKVFAAARVLAIVRH